jgi:ATP-binding cassette, subfamily F, member 3
MLDEPTNHLDMHSCDLLIEALNKYEGTVILVSHDRYFINRTANKIWEIVDHQIKEFRGGYEEWVAWNERMAAQKITSGRQKNKPEKEAAGKTVAVKQQPGTGPTAVNKEAKKELQKQQRVFQQLEEKINQLKIQQQGLEKALTLPETYGDKKRFLETETEYKRTSSELSSLNAEYEKVFEKIMRLEKESDLP